MKKIALDKKQKNTLANYKSKSAEKVIIAICMLISLSVILSWALGIKGSLNIVPDSATMKFNTALVLLLASINLAIHKKKEKTFRIIHDTLSGISVLIGALTLLEYMGLGLFKIDNLFVTDVFSENNPGRMSPATALCFVLLGFSFIGIRSSNKAMGYISQYATKAVVIISLVAIIAHFLAIPATDKAFFFETMAIHTALLLLVISTILLLKSHKSEFSKLMTSELAGSTIARKLLPFIVLFPILLSYLLLTGINQEIVTIEFGVVAYTVILIPLSLVYILFLARWLNKIDAKRKKAEEQVKKNTEKAIEYTKLLESKNTQLIDFCNIVSHNLRAPLINISMLIDFIEKSEDEDEQKEVLGKIKPVINHLMEVFNELVESLQVKQDFEIKSSQIVLKDCLEKTLINFQAQIKEYGADVQLDLGDVTTIYFPQKYLESIVANLLSNTLKYRSPDRNPVIAIKASKAKNNTILFSVTDNGLGIDLKLHKDQIFKIRKTFHEHPNAKGFGLFMTKTQVESMGGKIWVESEPGKGSTFFIEFQNQNI